MKICLLIIFTFLSTSCTSEQPIKGHDGFTQTRQSTIDFYRCNSIKHDTHGRYDC